MNTRIIISSLGVSLSILANFLSYKITKAEGKRISIYPIMILAFNSILLYKSIMLYIQ